jgi:outer membrane protein TolC
MVNLDQRAKLMDEAVARSDLDLANIDLLPKVLANAGYVHRNNVEASSSTSILTGRQSLEPSTSSDQLRRSADLTLSWNILDFGVSYFAARQQADRTLIVEEQRRKIVHVMFQDIRRAYWRAAGAQLLSREVRATRRRCSICCASSRPSSGCWLRPRPSLRR